MMESIRLTGDGILIQPDGAAVAEALPALQLALELDADCTLRSFFCLLRRYPVLQTLSGFLPHALAELDNCPASGCYDDAMPALVLGKTMELIGFPGEPRAEMYCWLRGLEPERPENPSASASATGDGRAEPGTARQRPSMERLMEAVREIRFIPLQVLLDTPLYLGGLKHVVLGDANRHLLCETRFTLFEFVDGLAWELGFQGGTQQCSIGR